MTAPTAVIFDCDGVILQSNSLKSRAFAEVLREYEPQVVADFVAWHKATGGVSRFFKFAYFFRETLGDPNWEALALRACDDFGALVSEGLRRCPTLPGFENLVERLRNSGIPMAVNTGGAEDEVRQLFAERGIAKYFEAIFGSPTPKFENMEKLRDLGLAVPGSIYLGDAELDFDLARDFSLDFVYVSFESEWKDGAAVTQAAGGHVVDDLTALVRKGTPSLQWL